MDTAASYQVICRFDSRGQYVCDSVALVSPMTFDLIPDVYIGRLPAADGGEMKVMVDKIIAYRSTPQTAPCQAGGLLLSHRLFTSIGGYADATYYCEQQYSILRNPGSDFHTAVIDRIYEDSVSPQGAVISDTIRRTAAEYGVYFSRGYNIVLWYGHGCPTHIEVTGIAPNDYFTTDNAAAMQSTTYSNIITESCSVMGADSGAGIAKSFLVNPHGGAVSFTGSTTLDYSATRNVDFQNAFTMLFLDGVRYISKAFEIALIDQASLGSWVLARTDVYGLQYWGDPQMEIWSGQVSASDTFRLSPGKIGGKLRVCVVPARDSVLVCAYKAGAFFSRGYTTVDGYVDLDALPAGIEKVKISAQSHNRLPSSIVVDDADVGVLQFAGGSPATAPISVRFAKGSFFVNAGAVEPGARVTIEVYQASGRLVDRTTQCRQSQELILTPSSLSTGMYLIKVHAGSRTLMSGVTVVR
jgi:hypothetical protein